MLLTVDENTYHDIQGQLWCPLYLTQVHQGPGKEEAETQAGSLTSVHLMPCGRELTIHEKLTGGNGPTTNETIFLFRTLFGNNLPNTLT
jgi:hypothetical protein